MTITRYHGNSGRSERVSEKNLQHNVPPEKVFHGGTASLNQYDGDIFVLGIMVLLYLESRDTDFLIIAAVLFFCFYKDAPVLSKLTGLF